MKFEYKITLVISVYKNISFLDLVLKSVARQSFKDFEVIIAEDNDADEMTSFVQQAKEKYWFDIKHVSQPDEGFLKDKILNEATKVSSGELLVFIDGDCVLHPKFLYEYSKNMAKNTCLFGKRVLLGKEFTKSISNSGDVKKITTLNLYLNKNRKREEGIYIPFMHSSRKKGIKGCNFGLPKELLIAVNGFDEDFTEPWGGEDWDIERRLRLFGADFLCMKNKAIQYHLYHPKVSRGDTAATRAFFDSREHFSHEYFCKNGLTKK
ncbi:MAG: hypothetical protein C0603_05150 [Denitrovibrio sp.]|nr:MAG: hypothetical protein C0603_05150 [Denitrovibrio sp.]